MTGLYCDICDGEFEEEESIFHYSGIYKGELDGHIHVCNPCRINLDLPVIDLDRVINKKLLEEK